MERFGAKQLNAVWSWCAVNESEKKVFLSIWTDNMVKGTAPTSYIIQESDWGVNQESGKKSAARNDQDEKLALIFDRGYEAFGYFIVAKDPNAHPREIEETRTSFIMQLQLAVLEDGTVLGTPLRRIEIR